MLDQQPLDAHGSVENQPNGNKRLKEILNLRK